MRFDVLRPQRLAAAVTVYIEQFSAHPLERDAAELYAAPDGYLDANGKFSPERKSLTDVPVYEVLLQPEDGLYALPYMGRQANGSAWENDGVAPFASADQRRQPFYPDASHIFEEIDRLGVGNAGVGNLLSARADFDFYRAAPGGGYKKGLPAAQRTDTGEGDIPPERLGIDFFPHRPGWLLRQGQRGRLAIVTNMVQSALDSGTYAGAIWIEGSPSVEESAYWLSLLIDTRVPISCNASQRPHGALANDADHNIVDSVEYIVSRAWADQDGDDRMGVVRCQDGGQVFAAREVQKADARRGGYIATGGHGGIVGEASPTTPTRLTFVPTRRHTTGSDLNVRQLPASVWGVIRNGAALETVSVSIKASTGDLLPAAIPKVSIVKDAPRFGGDAAVDDGSRSAATEIDILARIAHNLEHVPLAGFRGRRVGTLRLSKRGCGRRSAAGGVLWNASRQSWARQQRRIRLAGSAFPGRQ